MGRIRKHVCQIGRRTASLCRTINTRLIETTLYRNLLIRLIQEPIEAIASPVDWLKIE